MDHYPEINVHERECSSRRPSNSSSTMDKPTIAHNKSLDGHLAPPLDTAFPSPDNPSEQAQALRRKDSGQTEEAAISKRVVEEYAQYTNAPPPYSEKQYEGKSEEQQNKMRMADYAKEIKRMMGRQLIKGIKSGETKVQASR